MDQIIKAAFADRGTRQHQKELGPSEVGDCRMRAHLRLNDHPVVNETLGMPGWMGTAIHKAIEANLRAFDPWGEEVVTELEVTSQNWPIPLRGHVDCYVPGENVVIDWKTTTKKNLRYFPKQQHVWQVHIYADMLREAGHTVNKVALVAIPRDGDERDVRVHRQDFDPSIVQQAKDWLQMVVDGHVAPDNNVSFCSLYCGFYDPSGVNGCAGK